MLWELLTREQPFDDFKRMIELEDAVIEGKRPGIPEETCGPYAVRYDVLLIM